MHSPHVSDGLLRSNLYLRFDSAIGRRIYELAVLTTARELDQQFEWTAHEPAALRQGLEPAVVDVVKFRRFTNQLARRDALVIEVGRALPLSMRHYASVAKGPGGCRFGDRRVWRHRCGPERLRSAAAAGSETTAASAVGSKVT